MIRIVTSTAAKVGGRWICGRRIWAALLILAALPGLAFAQTQPRKGIQDRAATVDVLTNARVHVAPGQVLVGATIVIEHGRIVAVGTDVEVPAGARSWDLTGKTVTAGFIDMDFRVPVDDVAAGDGVGDNSSGTEPSAALPTTAGRAWSRKIQPERTVSAGDVDADRIQAHRRLGFALAVVSPEGGVLSGGGFLLGLGDGDRRSPVAEESCLFGGLEYSRFGRDEYPNSLMGAIALLKQTLHDAAWYDRSWRAWNEGDDRQTRPEVNRSLRALAPLLSRDRSIALRSRSVHELLALGRIAQEFKLDAWFLGSGDEYQWLDDVVGLTPRIVLPVNFSRAPELDGPGGAAGVSLRDLEAWARAPENPARLAAAGASVALTPRGLERVEDFPARIRTAIKRGFDSDLALAALTVVPARMLGLSGRIGTVEAGRLACLTVFDGELFGPETRVQEVWVEGVRYPNRLRPPVDLAGTWRLNSLFPGDATLEVGAAGAKPSVTVRVDGVEAKHAHFEVDGDEVALTVSADVVGKSGYFRLRGRLGPERVLGRYIVGTGEGPDGNRVGFSCKFTGKPDTTAADAEKADKSPDAELWVGSLEEPIRMPLGARGRLEAPTSVPRLLIRGATLWTCDEAGILTEADLLVENGKIAAVGRGLKVGGDVTVVDGKGFHLTPGIVDAHSHTAILGGVNESTQSVTAEVRIRDVVWPDDINIYRQLAGGVTAAQLLHGSANPIGGQAAIVKWRWGQGAEALMFEGAAKTIKCALGENVKQSNWGDDYTTRYPQTRMGVEQVFRDAFQEARIYQATWAEFQKGRGLEPRRDLELDALVEVLDSQRLIHCHSYRQDEILMLMRVAEDFGFRIGTFQHVLEGYKVASEIAKHGAHGSSFSDWWAYKFEVYDAIPHNGALLHRAGVVTSFNSDSDELARRLNLEAAKAVKYGGVPREEALKFVTLNPAIQLGIGDRVGSLTVGKDADFVLWSGDPLSSYSRCEETWIEGRRYFQRAEDKALGERDRARRNQLIQRVLADRDRPNRDDRGKKGGTFGAPREGEACCTPHGK